MLTGYVFGSLPVFTEYIFLKTSRASSVLPFNKRKRGLSGNAKIAMQARNSGNEQIAKNTRHELISMSPFPRLIIHFCGMINHAIPETKRTFLFLRLRNVILKIIRAFQILKIIPRNDVYFKQFCTFFLFY